MRFVLLSCILIFCLSLSAQDEAKEIESATPIIERPGLFFPEGSPTREVFSLKELREKRIELAPRLLSDHMMFPLMPRPEAPIIREMLSSPDCVFFGEGYAVTIKVPWCDFETQPICRFLKTELQKQNIDQSEFAHTVKIDLLTFMTNFEQMMRLIDLSPEGAPKGKQYVKDRLAEIRQSAKQLLRFKEATLNGIRMLEEIDVVVSTEPEASANDFERMVVESEGMTEEDIQGLLDIRDVDQFQRLCLERTRELLGADMTVEQARKKIASMKPSEAIAAAAYFARSRLQAYSDPVAQMQDLSSGDYFDGQGRELQVGDCRHFAGLTLHYLNHVVKPINSGLKNWYFGVQTTHIRQYNHAFVKAVHLHEEDEGLDLFFFDPTVLAEKRLKYLTPAKVRRLIEATANNDHYFMIKRYAEDFVGRQIDSDAAFEEELIRLDDGLGEVDVLPLLEAGN